MKSITYHFLVSILAYFICAVSFAQNEVSVMEFEFAKDNAPVSSLTFPKNAITLLQTQNKIAAYTIKYDVEIALESEVGKDNYTIRFKTKEVSNSMYKGFSVAEYLQPEKISFDVIWGNSRGQEKASFKEVEFDVNHTAVGHASFPLTADYRPIVVENILFHYGTTQEKALRARINLIDEYYAEADKITIYLKKLAELEQTTKPEEAKKQLKPIETSIQKLDSYASELINDQEDPVRIREQIKTLKAAYSKTKSSIFPVDKAVCEANYQKAVSLTKEGKESAAEIQFDAILGDCPKHIPSLIRRAQLYYQKGEFNLARQDLAMVPATIDLTKEKDSELQTIAEGVYYDLFSFFIRKGDYASKSLNFEEAFTYFLNAEQICKQNPFLPNCETEIAPRLAKAQNDRLEYLDAQIQSALYENDLNEAVKYIHTAREITDVTTQSLEKQIVLLNEKLSKRIEDAAVIQDWEEMVSAIELKTSLAHSDSLQYWSNLANQLQTVTQKDALIYTTMRYSQLHVPTTNSLLKRLTQQGLSINEWEQLGKDIGKKDFYWQPQSNPETVISRYVLLDPALNKHFQKGYFQVWEELKK